jgi:serine-type D-Ala-D-Ala carboxypeptidase/endopeptidase (penicillin-binding protein 4)
MADRRSGWLVAAAVAVSLVGRVGADLVDALPGPLTVRPATGPVLPRPTASDPARSPLPQVLPGVSGRSPAPSSSGLAQVLDPLLGLATLGPAVSMEVFDPAAGQAVFERSAETGRQPASTTKLLTGAAVLSTVGGDSTLETKAVRGADPSEIVLVGGGDTLLGSGRSAAGTVAGRAGLASLAGQVARSLAAEPGRTYRVTFDDRLFDGPAVGPGWAAADVANGLTGRVTALGLAADRARPGAPGPAAPSAAAAAAFVRQLIRVGVTVSGTPRPARADADAGAGRPLGSVRSAPVRDVLALALAESDNALAEVLGRLTARAMNRPPTFAGAAGAVLDQVRELGIDTDGVRIADTSGLSRGSLLPARLLVDLLVLAAGDRRPELRPLVTGLPVAGFSGTLADRFAGESARAAAGVVRAKTGTLTGVGALAGVTVNADGRLLVFAVMADQVPANGGLAARGSLDRVVAALAGCGCR